MPEEVGNIVGFLVSKDANFMTGEVLYAVKGGL